jgi:hypothetical protein
LHSAFEENSTNPIPLDLPSSLFVKILTFVTSPNVEKKFHNPSSVVLYPKFLTNNSLCPSPSVAAGVALACGLATSSSDSSSSSESAFLAGAFLAGALVCGSSSESSSLSALTGAFLTAFFGDTTAFFGDFFGEETFLTGLS